MKDLDKKDIKPVREKAVDLKGEVICVTTTPLENEPNPDLSAFSKQELLKNIEFYIKENAWLKAENMQLAMMEEDAQKYALTKKEENKTLIGCVEHYADDTIWNGNVCMRPTSITDEGIDWDVDCGITAQETLKKLREK